MLLSSLRLAMSNLQCAVPGFVPQHDPSRGAYAGFLSSAGATGWFEEDSLATTPDAYAHLAGLARLFATKLGAGGHAPSVHGGAGAGGAMGAAGAGAGSHEGGSLGSMTVSCRCASDTCTDGREAAAAPLGPHVTALLARVSRLCLCQIHLELEPTRGYPVPCPGPT